MKLPLRGETVLITGASGHLGGVLADHLMALGAVVVGVDKVPPNSSRHQHVTLDIRLPFEVLASTRRPSSIVHLAYPLTHRRTSSEWRAMAETASLNVLSAAQACDARSVVMVSSTTAYGAHADNPLLREDHPLRPNAGYSYATGKADMEALALAWGRAHPEHKLVVARPCIVLGPRTDNYVVRSVLPDAGFVDGGDPRIQFLHEADFASAMTSLITRDGPSGVFNLTPDDSGVSRSQVHRLFGMPVETQSRAEVVARLSQDWQAGGPDAPHPAIVDLISWEWCAANDRLKRETGWAPSLSSLDTLLAYSKTLRAKRKMKVTV